jgi:hypothetical protein
MKGVDIQVTRRWGVQPVNMELMKIRNLEYSPTLFQSSSSPPKFSLKYLFIFSSFTKQKSANMAIIM